MAKATPWSRVKLGKHELKWL